MATVTGFVERIKYRNEENGYTVLSLNADGEEYILVGTFHYISEGEMVEAVGSMIEHPVYGQQLQVESYETLLIVVLPSAVFGRRLVLCYNAIMCEFR